MARTGGVGLILGAVLAAVVWLAVPVDAAASSWKITAFKGQRVEIVVVNSQRPNELAVVADGVLQITRDSGVVWQRSALPLVARTIVYDPTRLGVIYAGTDQGMYVSNDDGLSWAPFAPQMSHRIVLAAYVDTTYIFVSTWAGSAPRARLVCSSYT